MDGRNYPSIEPRIFTPRNASREAFPSNRTPDLQPNETPITEPPEDTEVEMEIWMEAEPPPTEATFTPELTYKAEFDALYREYAYSIAEAKKAQDWQKVAQLENWRKETLSALWRRYNPKPVTSEAIPKPATEPPKGRFDLI